MGSKWSGFVVCGLVTCSLRGSSGGEAAQLDEAPAVVDIDRSM